jgi:hypothetical protein
VTQLARLGKRHPSVALKFDAKIGDVAVRGTAVNTVAKRDTNYCDSSKPFSIRLRFNNSGVRRHPEYKKIRLEIIKEIGRKSKGSKVFAGFMYGVVYHLCR